MTDNGDKSFADLLNTVLDQHNLTVTALASRLEVSGPSLHRWVKGHEPRPAMRRKVLAILQGEHIDLPALPALEASKAPLVQVIVDDGMNMKLDMKVPADIAYKVIRLLFGHA